MQPRQSKGAVANALKSSVESRSCQASALQAIFAECATLGIPYGQSGLVTADDSTAADAVKLVVSKGHIINHEVLTIMDFRGTVQAHCGTHRLHFNCASRQLSKDMKQIALLQP